MDKLIIFHTELYLYIE